MNILRNAFGSKRAWMLAAALLLAPALHAAQGTKLPGVPQKQQDGVSSGGQQGNLPEVIIKGGEHSAVRSEKPLLDLQANPDDAVQPVVGVEEDLLNRQPEALRNPRAGFAESLADPNTVLPARIRLAHDPVKVFYPLREIMAISPSLSQEIGTGWEMAITDAEGRSIRKFNGRGLPPASVPWNGRSDRGEIIGVGKNYSTVITYRDVHGQTRNFVGEPFTFEGVIHQESKGLIISLLAPSMFEPKRGSLDEGLGASGTDLLREASDWIKRYYFTYPIRIEGYAKDSGLATTRAQATAKALTGLLLLPRGEIAATGTAAETGGDRIDIVIANR